MRPDSRDPNRTADSLQDRRDDGEPIGLSILGSTGSIGTQTLEVVRHFSERFRVRALSAGQNATLLAEQARLYRPDVVVIGDQTQWKPLREALADTPVEVLYGEEALCAAAGRPDVATVVAAVVGAAGLAPVLAALEQGKRVALANKETLVVGGSLVEARLARHGGTLIPVDSEHSAIYQCLVGEDRNAVEELILTASGGPFRTRPMHTFHRITRAEALRHPNWEMGHKITIDSATMMNKGLEVIEAYWLFGVDLDRIRVLVHPQSIVHSMVTFKDGSTKAQLGVPDMKVPIQYALTFPERRYAPNERIDWGSLARLDFEPPDFEKFRCLALAYEAMRAGGVKPAILNAANEEAVALFLKEQIAFADIPRYIEDALSELDGPAHPSYEDLVTIDATARRYVAERLSPAST